MTSRPLAALVLTLSLASAVPAVAAPKAGLEGDYRQRVICRGPQTLHFFHQLRIYRDHRGLRFVARAPLSYASSTGEDPHFSDVYYGGVERNGDVLTLRISPRYKRDYQDPGRRYSGQLIARDARYHLTPEGQLVAPGGDSIAFDGGACETTPFRKL